MKYRKFIEERFKIVSKQGILEDFVLNAVQLKYLESNFTGRDIILKARQQGFSSLITAMFTSDFILKEHSYSVIVADIEENAEGLLDKVKKYIQSYEDKTSQKVPLKYNSKNELYNPFMDTRFKIGTAKNTEFGRSRTITNLHLSECAYFPSIENIIAGAGQAVVEGGKFIIETTANGFNEFKSIYEDSLQGLTGFKALFYKASDFYSKEFLEKKKVELGEKFAQEYPENAIEAFTTSGQCYFNSESLEVYLNAIKKPLTQGVVYV